MEQKSIPSSQTQQTKIGQTAPPASTTFVDSPQYKELLQAKMLATAQATAQAALTEVRRNEVVVETKVLSDLKEVDHNLGVEINKLETLLKNIENQS